jgi:hypothetical protein
MGYVGIPVITKASVYSISRGTLDLRRDVNVVKERTISRCTYRQHTETNSEFAVAS